MFLYLYWKDISRITSSPSLVLDFKLPAWAYLSVENSIVVTVFGNLKKLCPIPKKYQPAEYTLGDIY
jgi:hypothetical protein